MSRRADIITAALAVVIHGAAVFAIARRHAAPSAPRPRPVEVEFRRPTPPPPPPTAVAPAPPPSRTAPRAAPRRLATTAAPRPTAPAPAPSARPAAAKAPPVYAIAMESPTDASSPVAAPRGGGSSRGSPLGAGRTGGDGGGGSSAGSGAGTGSGLDVKRMPEIDTEACGRSAAYPSEAERAGVEGKVRLRVALDAAGRVTSARVLRGLGHGLDEAAVEALTRRCRFTPALASDGRPVPFVIESYSFVFELPR